MKHVRRHGGNVISIFEEFRGRHLRGAAVLPVGRRAWRPPLPPDVEPPVGTGEPSRSIARSSSSEPRRPNWMLSERETGG